MENLMENEQSQVDKIVLPKGYSERLQAYIQEKKTGLDDDLEQFGEEGLALNRYQGREADKAVILSDIEALDLDVQKELALYAISLLNPLRTQLGSVAVEVSDFALDYASSLAQSLHSSLRFHNYDSLVAIAKIKGVEPKGKDCLAFSEYREVYSLYDAKELIYQALTWRLFDDSHADYGHSAILLGIEQEEAGDEQLGLAFSRYSLNIDWLLTHMIFIPKDWILETGQAQ